MPKHNKKTIQNKAAEKQEEVNSSFLSQFNIEQGERMKIRENGISFLTGKGVHDDLARDKESDEPIFEGSNGVNVDDGLDEEARLLKRLDDNILRAAHFLSLGRGFREGLIWNFMRLDRETNGSNQLPLKVKEVKTSMRINLQKNLLIDTQIRQDTEQALTTQRTL